MGNEVDSGLISEISILGCIVILVSKCTDDTVSSKSLIHKGVHWSMECVANSVKLIVNTQVWFYDEVEKDHKAYKEKNDPVAEIDQDEEDTEKSKSIIEDSIETMEDSSVKYMNVIREHLEQLANWSNIKEKIYWSIHYS